MINLKVFQKRLTLLHVTFIILHFAFFNSSCTPYRKISRQADNILLKDSLLSMGHAGICIYEPATQTYWYERQSGNYFIPASNTKLFTLYAGMKYLGDSITGLLYQVKENGITAIIPTGDPTFLHPGFNKQPILSFLQSQKSIQILFPPGKFEAYGSGWAWDDYMESYMVPRSSFPIYGNMVYMNQVGTDIVNIFPQYFREMANQAPSYENGFDVKRGFNDNRLIISDGLLKNKKVPFYANEETLTRLLDDTLKTKTHIGKQENVIGTYLPLYSRPSDSLFTPMMHDSDNYLAEQVLLMACDKKLGYMCDGNIIDTILKTLMYDVPHKPRWVDGSGLSRYNLFTPKSFVYILEKMKNEFGMHRMKTILPTGGEGSLSNYFESAKGSIFAKSGTLSNNSALSGYLYTQKGRLLIFSILLNHYPAKAAGARHAMENFLLHIRNNY